MLSSGTRLGPYEIVAPLGAGGMGEVYRARDTRLDRTVAIKVLPPDVSQDADRRGRFEREARAIAALSHPNICRLYDVGRERDIDYLVMELIEGRTLADRLQSGALDLDEALVYATQIADALATAHRHGIVHRDLKPGNVMLARSGSGSVNPPQAKLLDFGLARLRPDPAIGEAATATGHHTGPGQILGTLGYMAPEQLEGKPHDARVDVFALGAIVFEMITGRRAFDGPNPASVAGAILHLTPPALTAVLPHAPAALERLLNTCLAKHPDDRWSSAHDVLLQLRAISPTADAPPGRTAASRPARAWMAWSVAAVAAIVAAAAWLVPSRVSDAGPSRRLDVVSILPPAGAATSHAWEAPQLSPDGRHVAIAASDASGTAWLYVRSRDAIEARRLPGTEEATQPFWAPDSTRIAFFASGQLKTTSLAGGAPRVLAPAPVPRGGAWNASDVILFAALPNSPPQLVPAGGGEVTVAPSQGVERGFRSFPQWLPDGRHYIFQSLDATSRVPVGLRVASIDSSEVTDLVKTRGHGVYVEGRLLYRRDATLVAQTFDLSTRQVDGVPVAIADDVGFNPITYQSLFSASADAIASLPSPRGTRLVWFDRQGRPQDALTPPGDFNTVCLTADERRVVYEQADAVTGTVDLWQTDVQTRQTTRLTFEAAVDFYPVCGPAGASGQEVIFASLRGGAPNLFRLPTGAPGSEKPALVSPVAKIPSHWTRDGRSIVLSLLNRKTGWDIAMWNVDGGEPTELVATAADERNGQVSPDGRWLAFTSRDSGGPWEVHVQPFPAGGAKWQVSRGGGSQPLWRKDGRELYYITPDRKLVAVPVKASSEGFFTGEVQALMEAHLPSWDGRATGGMNTQYAAAADGQRFLISTATGDPTPIALMLNWQSALRARETQ